MKNVNCRYTNEKSVSTVLSSIGRNLLKTDVTWGKIASLYCVAGGLAIDCVQQGHPEYLYGIVETMGFVIERDAATWIAQQGGWVRTKCCVIFHGAVLGSFRPAGGGHFLDPHPEAPSEWDPVVLAAHRSAGSSRSGSV